MYAILEYMPEDYRGKSEERILEVISRARNYSCAPHLPVTYWGGNGDDEVQIPGVCLLIWTTVDDGPHHPATLFLINNGDSASHCYNTFNLGSINFFMQHTCAVHGIFCGDHYYLAQDERRNPINVDLPRFFNESLRGLYDAIVQSNI
jgi:hypothetical protein